MRQAWCFNLAVVCSQAVQPGGQGSSGSPASPASFRKPPVRLAGSLANDNAVLVPDPPAGGAANTGEAGRGLRRRLKPPWASERMPRYDSDSQFAAAAALRLHGCRQLPLRRRRLAPRPSFQVPVSSLRLIGSHAGQTYRLCYTFPERPAKRQCRWLVEPAAPKL